MSDIFVSLIIFFGVLIQSLCGFGMGLVVMPLLSQVIDIRTAAPLLSLLALMTLLSVSFYYRASFQFKAVIGLVFASSLAIPFGIYFLKNINPQITLTVLGIIILSYALYALLELPYPLINSPKWGYGFAFCSGLLSGAYNTGGPPIVIYASCRRWTPEIFKSNLNFFFLANTIIVGINHTLQKNLTGEVWRLFFYNIPIVVLGLLIGFSLSRYLNPIIFRKFVLGLLVITGSSLLLKVFLFS